MPKCIIKNSSSSNPITKYLDILVTLHIFKLANFFDILSGTGYLNFLFLTISVVKN